MEKRRYIVIGVAIAGLLAIYALAGFLAVPRIVAKLAADVVRADYGRELAIGSVRFNPFTLRLEVGGLALPDADGGPLLAFDRLLLDLEVNSLWRRAFSFREIVLDGLAVNAVVRRGGALNLADLQVPPDPAAPPAADEPLPRLFIGKLAISDGRVRFEDRDRAEPFLANIAPIAFTLTNFSTHADAGEQYTLDAVLFESSRFTWSGSLNAQPLASDGEFTLRDLPLPRVATFLGDALPVEVPSGTATVRGRYRLLDAPAGLDFVVAGAEISADSLAVRPRGADVDYVSLDKLAATGLGLSLAAQTAEVGEIAVTGGNVQVWLTPAGELNLAALAGPPAAPADPAAPAEGAAAPGTGGSDWALGIPRVTVRNLAVNLEDRSIEPASLLALQPLGLTIEGFSTRPGTSVKTTLETVVNEKGNATLAATTNLDTLATDAELELRDIGLAVAQPYIERETSLELVGGTLTAKGQLTYADASPEPQVEFKGDISVDGLRTIDKALREDFVRWNALRLLGIEYRSAPQRLRIRSVDARGPYARVIIGPDGTTNVAAILAGPGATAGPAAGPTVSPAETRDTPPAVVTNPEADAPGGAPFPIRIGSVKVTGGSARFADFTTRPNFDIGIGEIAGTVSGLSSEAGSRAAVELDGQVGKFSPVTIRGEVNPLAAETFLDMAMTFRNVELASFTPYSGRFAGYSIRQGKLSMDLNYKVNDRKLDADHEFVIDQLELGDKVDSPDAVSLPLKLAVALLKDRNGVIDLDLPVQGDIDDPEFRVGPIVWKAFVNLLTKAVTAPFALLGSLFGGGEDLNLISFAAGEPGLGAAGEEKAATLVKALTERPGLKLRVPAVFNRAVDEPALREAGFRDLLVGAQRAELTARRRPADDVTFATLSSDPEEYQRLLTRVFREQAGPDAPLPEAPPYSDDPAALNVLLEDGVRQRIDVPDADLFALARRRAEAVQARLLTDTGLDPARVFLTSPAEGKAGDSGVVMELALE